MSKLGDDGVRQKFTDYQIVLGDLAEKQKRNELDQKMELEHENYEHIDAHG